MTNHYSLPFKLLSFNSADPIKEFYIELNSPIHIITNKAFSQIAVIFETKFSLKISNSVLNLKGTRILQKLYTIHLLYAI
jgi:hypothetical protein